MSVCGLNSGSLLARRVQEGSAPPGSQEADWRDALWGEIASFYPWEPGGGLCLPSFEEQQGPTYPPSPPTCPPWPGWEPVPPAGLMLGLSASGSRPRVLPTPFLSHLHPSVLLCPRLALAKSPPVPAGAYSQSECPRAAWPPAGAMCPAQAAGSEE